MTAPARVDRVPEIRRSLTDVHGLCSALGLMKGAKRQGGKGLSVCCPSHGEKVASCSVTLGPDGTIRVRCFSCDFAGDVFHLIAAVRGLDLKRDFPEILREAAALAGIHDFDAGGSAAWTPPAQTAPPPRDDRSYPLQSEVGSVWAKSIPVTAHDAVAAWLTSRGLDPEVLARTDAARALPLGANLPRWASFKGDADEPRSWAETGHALIFPVYDPKGQRVSVRAGRIIDGKDAPKRLPPAGHLSAGLVLANKAALAVLGHGARYDVLIVEGEPDFLTWAAEPVAVFSVGSGWWTKAHANRIPGGTKVVIRTHQDAAGDKYAEEIARTLARRCPTFRPAKDDLGDENDRLRAGVRAATFDEGAISFTIETVDPRSFYVGKLFSEYYWLGDELKPGVFAARCPGEALHRWGERFDGSSVVRAPERPGDAGTFRCAHPECRDNLSSLIVVDNYLRRVAAAEGA